MIRAYEPEEGLKTANHTHKGRCRTIFLIVHDQNYKKLILIKFIFNHQHYYTQYSARKIIFRRINKIILECDLTY